jgi:4-diphosphocytidyl-2-C-methyl-D-erythritol kinase
MPFSINAYAKINLTLDIAGKREDGYHLLRMVMQSVSLCDRVLLTRDKPGIHVACAREDVPCGRENTAYKAAEFFFESAGLEPDITIQIEKKIPSQAGLGGGSSDAAAVLLALNRMYGTGFSKEFLCDIGVRVGADVPFCILGGTALAEGIGEKLTPLPALKPCHVVICKPPVGVNTKQAFVLADASKDSLTSYTDAMLDAIRYSDLLAAASRLGNGFEQVMKLDEVTRIKEAMNSMGALGSCMSGSGSAVFAVFENMQKASACRDSLANLYPDVYLCEPVTY